MSTYPRKNAGQPTVLHHKDQTLRIACCDCGLVHIHQFDIDGEHLIERAWRDLRATAQLRRHGQFDLQMGKDPKWRMIRKRR